MQSSSIDIAVTPKTKPGLRLLLLPLVILAGMGLSVEAVLLGPLGVQVGHLWATLSIFGVGSAILFLLLLFRRRSMAGWAKRSAYCAAAC